MSLNFTTAYVLNQIIFVAQHLKYSLTSLSLFKKIWTYSEHSIFFSLLKSDHWYDIISRPLRFR